MPLTSSASYPGIDGIRAVRFPFSRGVTPSTACIYCAPQNVDSGGSLVLEYNGVPLTFPDMAVASAHIRKRYNGHPIMAVYLMDRRWKWKGVTVGGDWNRRASDGTVDSTTQKSPAELASLILNQIGESGYDVSRMPGGVYPRCNWQNTRADIALQRLCDYVACEVVLNPLTNRVEIWPSGTGNSTTGDGSLYGRIRFAPRAFVPNRVAVLCGDSLWQSKLLLQAACRDYPSNEQKSLTNTNIRPSGGWDYEHPWIFAGLSGNSNARVRAFEDVYRTYRVIGQANGTLGVSNFPFPINSPNQYILQDTTLEVETDYKGAKHQLPAYVDVGECWGYTLGTTNATSARSFVPFELELDRQMVRFNVPLFKLSSAGVFQEPTLYLVTSYKLRTEGGYVGGLYRYGTVGGSGGDLLLKRPEIFSVYDFIDNTHTESQAIAEADSYVGMFLRKYSNPWSSEATYPGLVFANLDGNIAQVTWEVAAHHAPRTTIYEGDEYDVLALSGNDKRRNLKLEDLQ